MSDDVEALKPCPGRGHGRCSSDRRYHRRAAASGGREVSGVDHADRYDEHGRIRFMTRSDGYVMVRRPHCMPFVLAEKKWLSLSLDALVNDAPTTSLERPFSIGGVPQ